MYGKFFFQALIPGSYFILEVCVGELSKTTGKRRQICRNVGRSHGCRGTRFASCRAELRGKVRGRRESVPLHGAVGLPLNGFRPAFNDTQRRRAVAMR